jgi:hypothetical protein
MAVALAIPLSSCSHGPQPLREDKGGKPIPAEGPTGTEAALAAKKFLEQEDTVELKGGVHTHEADMKVHGKGSVTGSGDFRITMVGTVDGKDMSMDIRGVGSTIYFKASKENFDSLAQNYDQDEIDAPSGEDMAKAAGDKYVSVPREQAKDLGDMTLSALVESIFDEDDLSADKLDRPEAKGTLTTVEGIPAYQYELPTDPVYSDSEGASADPDADRAFMYLRADGSGDFLGSKSQRNGTMLVKAIDHGFKVSEPAEKETISLEDLDDVGKDD